MINSVLSGFNLSILDDEHPEDMDSVCQKPGLHFETYE